MEKIKRKKRKIGTPVNRRQRVRARLLLHRGKRENGNRTTHVNEVCSVVAVAQWHASVVTRTSPGFPSTRFDQGALRRWMSRRERPGALLIGDRSLGWVPATGPLLLTHKLYTQLICTNFYF
jgi:hypothetical protein